MSDGEWTEPLADCPSWCTAHSVKTFAGGEQVSRHFRSLYRMGEPINESAAIRLDIAEDTHNEAASELLPDRGPSMSIRMWEGHPESVPASLSFTEAERLVAALTEGISIVRTAAEAWCACGEPMGLADETCWRCHANLGIQERKARRAAMRVVQTD